MYILGHVGFAVLLMFLLKLPFLFGILGSQMPDLIDKPLLLFGLAPNGRYIGHTLLAMISTTAVVYIVFKDLKKTLAFLVGYISHILADLYAFIPFLYPFKHYDFVPAPFVLNYTLPLLIADDAGLLVLILVYRKSRRFREEAAKFFGTIKKKLSNI